jgi:type IV pilus biogenesis/stability protein PilW
MKNLFRIVLMALLVTGCVTQKRQSKAQARVRLGTAYLKEGTTELAIATLREATEMDPRNVDAWDHLALALMKRGALDQAESSFKTALKLNPESAQVNLNYSFLLINTDRSAEAIAALEMALKDLTYRQPAKILNNLGYACLLDGQIVRAILHLREAVIRSPNDCQAWFNLGIAQEKNKLPKDAIDSFDRVIMTCPTDAQGSYFRAAELLMAEGRADEGVHYMQQSCTLSPGTDLGALATERLKEWGDVCPLGQTTP